LLIELTNGAAITIPVKLIPGLKRAAPSDVRAVEVLGRIGGTRSSAAKAAAARRNGRKGGRPRNRPSANAST
jgi:hypothetical protein